MWALSIALALLFVSLLGVQYLYYNRVDTLRREQTLQLVHLALDRVIHEVEIREFVRYLNDELNAPSPLDTLASEDIAFNIERFRNKGRNRLSIKLPSHIRELEEDKLRERIDTLVLNEQILGAFIHKHEMLDEYILSNIYKIYSYDSIPQLVNPHFLVERIDEQLRMLEVSELFSLSLYGTGGQLLYEYAEPGMTKKGEGSHIVITKKLFLNGAPSVEQKPNVKLVLDFTKSHKESLMIMIPGLIISVIVFVISIVVVLLIFRQLSFDDMKTNFINNMTHELKTPVSTIQLSLEQLERSEHKGEGVDKRVRYFSIMEAEIRRLQILIDKVLQLSFFVEGKPHLALSNISIDEIVLNAANIFSTRAQIEGNGGELILEHNAENTWIKGNETHMTNILYNLLENAIKYRRTDRPLWLRLSTRNNSMGQLVICVEDNGIGIPEGEVKRIFDRFYRVSTGLKHESKGYGLGLAYVKHIVKQFKGRITAYSREEGGTRIEIVLPTLA